MRLRYEVGVSAGCTALVAGRPRANGMEITGTAGRTKETIKAVRYINALVRLVRGEE